MSHDSLDRRRFHELSAAALSGLVAGAMTGSLAGCGKSPSPPTAGGPAANSTADGDLTTAAAMGEKHLCRGLNDCKGEGLGGKNDCRGQGDCATFAKHTCSGENGCKGQGGCGETAGLNECKGQGHCAVPLMVPAWKAVRERKEAAWSKAAEKFGNPPEKSS